MIKVCHITSAHPKADIRIFQKECVSLANAGYDVTLVQQGEDSEQSGVHIIGFGDIPANRLKRMLFTAKRAYKKALDVDAEVYHLHDPELLPYGLKLKRKGKKVLFDSHEDVPADILCKYWIPAWLRKFISRVYTWYENYCFARIDGTVGVTPSLCTRLTQNSRKSTMVTNYPVWQEDTITPTFENKSVAFTGLVSEIWCIDTLVKAVEPLDEVTVELRSRDVEEPFGSVLRDLPGWKKVNFPGRVPHAEVIKLLSECLCGIALLQEMPNSGGKLGTLGNTKIFEYMMVGIPVICTDFILWKQIIDKWQCGICVNPKDENEVRAAIKFLLEHPEEAQRMGQNGRQAIREEFNWEQEEKKLFAFYREILGQGV